MFRLIQRDCSGGSGKGRNPARLAAMLFMAGCATATTTSATRPETVPSHVYPLPLDNVLAQAAELLVQKGWKVQRSGNNLLTNWVRGEGKNLPSQQLQVEVVSLAASLVAYRILGERIDAGYCTIRVERLVATESTLNYGSKRGGHQVEQTTTTSARSPTAVHNENRTLQSPFSVLPPFLEDSANDAQETGAPSEMVVSQQERDPALELELQKQIDPDVVAATKPADAGAVEAAADALADAGTSAALQQAVSSVQHVEGEPHVGVAAPLVADRRPTGFAGIWTGTFTFRGKVTGAYSGEVTVAVDGHSVEIDDFCPEIGGTVTAQGTGNSASWQGKLACPAIRMSGCRAAIFTYDFVHATLNEGTLTVVASGTVDTGGRCVDSGGELSVGGPLSVAFVAEKADYVHIAVTKVKKTTECVWPRDWEDFASSGSMSMPDPPLDDAAYLGVIRAKGSRLTEIQRLLRHCRQVVLLHGQPVLMRLAVTRPHQQ